MPCDSSFVEYDITNSSFIRIRKITIDLSTQNIDDLINKLTDIKYPEKCNIQCFWPNPGGFRCGKVRNLKDFLENFSDHLENLKCFCEKLRR